ncbi:MAG: 2OG-Fe(II) oxygenase [Halieaceae bacterium]|nr:2OG-Fe(II) oxygenase [Halieaceae bacterium]
MNSIAPTRYLNTSALEAISASEFQRKDPFPWVNPQYFISPEHYQELLDNMPDISEFRAFFGKQRKHGQGSHDRYVLDYEDGMTLHPAWQAFVDELRGPVYRDFVCRMLDVSDVRFRFHWHFTPNGGEVTPHCDSKGKIGSQIFYLNTGMDWNPDWGGETVVLDDSGRITPDNAPAFEDFDAEYPAETADNRSLLFGRRGNSWHGVRKINCPEGYYRKVFIVVFEEHRPLKMAAKKFKRLVTGKPLVTHKESLMY